MSIAAIYYTLTLRYTRRNQDLQLEARQTQIIMQAYQRMSDSKAVALWIEVMSNEWDSVEEYFEDLQSFINFTTLSNYFEGVGILLKKGLVDRALVYEFYPTNVNALWKKYEPIIMWTREGSGSRYLRTVEYLAGEMDKERILQGDPPIREYWFMNNKKTELN